MLDRHALCSQNFTLPRTLRLALNRWQAVEACKATVEVFSVHKTCYNMELFCEKNIFLKKKARLIFCRPQK